MVCCGTASRRRSAVSPPSECPRDRTVLIGAPADRHRAARAFGRRYVVQGTTPPRPVPRFRGFLLAVEMLPPRRVSVERVLGGWSPTPSPTCSTPRDGGHRAPR